jgi:hypothetical protein
MTPRQRLRLVGYLVITAVGFAVAVAVGAPPIWTGVLLFVLMVVRVTSELWVNPPRKRRGAP